MKVVLAFDRFKGTFTAQQVCEIVTEGIRDRNPKIEVIQRPMAAGGEGSASLLAASLGMEKLRVEALDLLGNPTEAHIYWHNARRLAIVESSEVLGANLCLISEENLFRSSSFGLGTLIRKAFELRPQELWVCLGDTLTADAGWGVASAFGLIAHNEHNQTLRPSLKNMDHIHELEFTELPEYVKRCKINLLCDLSLPAKGGLIELNSFLHQKGAKDIHISNIEKKLTTFWAALKGIKPQTPTLEDAYTGASGGIILGLSAIFPHAKIELGSKRIASTTALAASFADARLVVTGEGRLDELSVYGKVIQTVSQLASKKKIKLLGIFGKVDHSSPDLKQKLGFTQVNELIQENEKYHSVQELIRISRLKLYHEGNHIADTIDPNH